ncbi:hypothetical protein TAMA11512_13800 [Selenomonas sp. TAMA-11512]|uniref:TRAP transporter small permease n=1 Tax=Selenomonas sp. TAMA-11512 TaxID=3095337 RepID=UPI003091DDD6|nr:hypothetical protein TAMA11512_13800 [Selenomonas sp. TAMA-11512]
MKQKSSVVEYLDSILSILTHLAAFLAGIFILATALIIVYEIISRGVFHAPTEWALEISTYLILCSGFLGLAITARKNAHIRVDLFINRFSTRNRLRINAFLSVLSLLFFLVFITESTDVVQDSILLDRTSPSTLRFPLFIPQLSLVLGGSLLFGEISRSLLHDIRGLRLQLVKELRKGGAD